MIRIFLGMYYMDNFDIFKTTIENSSELAVTRNEYQQYVPFSVQSKTGEIYECLVHSKVGKLIENNIPLFIPNNLTPVASRRNRPKNNIVPQLSTLYDSIKLSKGIIETKPRKKPDRDYAELSSRVFSSIKVTDRNKNKVVIYKSMTKASQELGINPGLISRALKYNKPYNEYYFERVNS